MDTIPANTSTTEVLTPGGSRTSTIDTLGDRDWFQAALIGGFSYQILLEGTGTASELPRVEFFVYDSTGNLLLNDADINASGFEFNTFSPGADGTYYIAAAGYNDTVVGDYILSLGNDDIRSGVATQATVAPGQSTFGTINTAGDRDWHEITLAANLSYNIRLEGTGTATELGRVEYFVYDAMGNLLFNDADVDDNGVESNTFTTSSAGTYYISAAGYNDLSTGDYELTVGTDDVRRGVTTQDSVAPGGSVSGSIETFGDRDWYEISLQAGFSYNVRLEGTGVNDLGRVEFFVYNSAGTLLYNDADINDNGIELSLFTPSTDATYYIAAAGYDDLSVGDYTLSVGTDEARNSVATQQSISIDGSVNGVIDGLGDRDWYAVDLEEGFSYSIRLEGTGTQDELSRVEFFVYDSAGTLRLNDADVNDTGIELSNFTPTSDGRYYIAAAGYNDGHTGEYTLSLASDDARNSVTTQQSIAAGEAVTGTIGGLGDRDWYRTSLVAGEDYTITLEGDGSASELGRVEYFVYDSIGNLLVNDADTNADGIEFSVYTPTTSGTYYIAAAGYNDGQTGEYILSLAGDRPLTIGSNQDDTLVGDSAAENFSGLAGDDAIIGGGGNDIIDGGTGDDVLLGGNGNDLIYGEEGVDSLFGGNGSDRLDGGAGADTLNGGAGSDFAEYITSGSGLVVDLQFTSSSTGDAAGDVYSSIENLRGSELADDLRGDASGNRIDGRSGSDMIRGRAGDDDLRGNSGDDVLIGGTGADKHFGGAGVDRADYSDAGAGLIVDLQAAQVNTGIAAGDTYADVEDLGGSDFNDNLRGDTGSNTITGRRGDDYIRGRDGDDFLIGSAGDDILRGGNGADKLTGGSGIDVADYRDSGMGLLADLQFANNNTGIAAGDTYLTIEDIFGSSSADSLRGNGAANTISGFNGNDFLVGRSGADTLVGGNGNDILRGGTGADTLNGGAGQDRADYSDATFNVRADLVNSAVNVGAYALGDIYISIEDIRGSSGFNDDLRGDANANVLEGLSGNDKLVGRAGNDTLAGGAGNDTLTGGSGNDVLIGGIGADAFVFSAPTEGLDSIVGFAINSDTIHLDDSGFTSLSAGALAAGNFRLGAAAVDANDFLVYDGTTLFYDADGSGAGAQVALATFNNNAALDENDFLIV